MSKQPTRGNKQNDGIKLTRQNTSHSGIRPNTDEEVYTRENTPLMSTQATDQNAAPKDNRTVNEDRRSDSTSETERNVAPEVENNMRLPQQEENNMKLPQQKEYKSTTIEVITNENSAPSDMPKNDQNKIPKGTPAIDENNDNQRNRTMENAPKEKHVHSWQWKHTDRAILGVSIAILSIFVIVNFVQNQQYHHPQPEAPPPPQFHHAMFDLKTSGYTELEKATNLHWKKKDESQNVGNFQLVDETYISVPQDGIYLINCAVQLYIPKDSPSVIITFMLQKKNGTKYEYIKKSSNSLKDIAEEAMIQSSFTYKFKANDTIFLKMTMAKFISPNTPSSYLSITSLHINNHQ